MSKPRPILSGVIGGSLGPLAAFVAVRSLGTLWGVLAVVTLGALLYGAVELWYRVIWPLDSPKPSLRRSSHSAPSPLP